jgi:hypothetical protein
MSSELAVREAFADQAHWCRELGSPFTGLVCDLLAARLEPATAVGAHVLNWQGDPKSLAGALPLRLAGALHALVLRGQTPALAALYPPAPMPDAEGLWTAISRVLEDHADAVIERLRVAPQTNEVGRSAAVMFGLMTLADENGLPFDLLELGCSAGLNLNLGRFAYNLGGTVAGDPASPVRVEPRWTGDPPPRTEVIIRSARGVDVSPLSVADAASREKLTAYIWPDQIQRLARVRAAIALALDHPPRAEQGEAAEWLERNLPLQGEAGAMRVVFHTIAFQYFPPASQRRIREHLARAGLEATPEAPLAWLRLEADPQFDGRASLRLTTWPGRSDRLLAMAHPHGTSIKRI